LNYFGFTENSTPRLFTESSNWEPNWDRLADPVKREIGMDIRILREAPRSEMGRDNLMIEERRALSRLKRNSEDKSQYLTEALRQLQNTRHYIPLKKIPFS